MVGNNRNKLARPVTEWVENTSALSPSRTGDGDEIENGTASRLCDISLQLLKSLLPLFSQKSPKEDKRVEIQEIMTKLQLWHGFAPGELERILARTESIQNAVLRRLIAIGRLIKDRK